MLMSERPKMVNKRSEVVLQPLITAGRPEQGSPAGGLCAGAKRT